MTGTITYILVLFIMPGNFMGGKNKIEHRRFSSHQTLLFKLLDSATTAATIVHLIIHKSEVMTRFYLISQAALHLLPLCEEHKFFIILLISISV